ncbi:MAG: tRNA (N6-isopentenyl adenosine(37)-C2)-methylthiotransferase MiaB, partial [Clostridia bacterium]|nr:tRNA (N6-isopentenyl adenosine(37)-C2)-methylthiotransferase MiaB [Clostridia bacterium]
MENTIKKKYHIVTYGCQMNLHESEKMAGILSKAGYAVTDKMEDADVILFNTCCIRENAENHAFGNIGALKKLKREKPDLIIAVGGCMTQEKGKAEVIRQKFPFVDIIFGNLNLEELGDLVEKKSHQKKKIVSLREKEGEVIEYDPPLRNSFPNAWVNIMYGCNNFCTYCIVPYVRGRERSRKPEHIIAECKQLIEDGYREITLLGQNVNSYGNDGATDMRFPELLEKVAQLDGDFRLRFMTSNPKDFGEELVKVIARNKKICHLVHLPAQSGNNRVLQAMNRKYTVEAYKEKVELLRKYVPDAELTTDLMVAFPGETEEEFEDTVKLVQDVGFSSAFTFVYSKRSG